MTRRLSLAAGLVALCTALPSASFAQSDACTVATTSYQAAVSTLSAAIANYQQCIGASNGTTDCAAEASAVASEQIAFAAAVEADQSACAG